MSRALEACMRNHGASDLVARVLGLVNAVRSEAGDPPLKALPLGSLAEADRSCPVARALSALVLVEDQRVVFCHAWYAAAAAKVWEAPFRDVLLLSVAMPDAIRDFALRFRSGAFPELLERPDG
jgi:hypothetical protein